MTTALYFAAPNSSHTSRDTFGRWDWDSNPLNVLVAFVPKEGFNAWVNRPFKTKGLTMLDSGAFSAWKSGSYVDLQELRTEALKPEWDEIVALDVIGSPTASKLNALAMKHDFGSRVIPVFHYGESWEMLL